MSGGILALDMATVTGWAYAPPVTVRAWPQMPTFATPNQIPELFSGTRRIKTSNRLGAQIKSFDAMIQSLFEDLGKPAVIVFEQSTKGHLLMAMNYHIRFMAEVRGIPAFPVHVNAWRKHLTGSMKTPKSDTLLHYMRKFGVETESLDEADAVGILNFAIEQNRRGQWVSC